MKEYVLKISVRDTDHPLMDNLILEFGVPVDSGILFVEAVRSLANLLQELKTPEKVAALIETNQVNTGVHLELLHKTQVKR